MNRAPGKSDHWWTRHEAECGGTYTKIHEPAPTQKKLEAMSKKERAGRQKNKLDDWLKPKNKQEDSTPTREAGQPNEEEEEEEEEDHRSAPALGKRKAAEIN